LRYSYPIQRRLEILVLFPASTSVKAKGQAVDASIREIVIGLVSAAIAAICAWFFNQLRKRHIRMKALRNYPVDGIYASRYKDELGGAQRTIKDQVTIAQHGLDFTGVSRNLETGRSFRLQGRIVSDRYLAGVYGGEHRADTSNGVFFMGLDLLDSGRVEGLWSGHHAESGAILSGSWAWRRLQDVDIAECEPSSPLLAAATTLLNDALGSGVVTSEDLRALAASDEGAVLVATGSQHNIVGVATAMVLDDKSKAELEEHLSSAGIRRTNLNGSSVGILKSAAVIPEFRGQGVGLKLVNGRLSRLQRMGCSTAIAAAWDSGTHNSSVGVLESAGFERLAELKEYWREPAGQETFDCLKCGRPCLCSAIVMRRRLYDFVNPDEVEPTTVLSRLKAAVQR
jgi:ribosomal protein S18 acetylase RimI-like enzyme